VRYGIDRVDLQPLKGRRLGILAHQASVTTDLEYSFVKLKKAGLDLRVIFAPEHGLYSTAQDQVAIEGGIEPITGIPIVSLYPPNRWEKSILAELDLLIIDIFDIGARYYTYLWSATELIEAAANQKILILDRPNPIGRKVEGPIIEPDLFSFVGPYPIPIRHGMTPGELLSFLNERYLKKNLEVVPLEGWDGGYFQGIWIPPSPNIPSLSTAIVYPGACLIEGTNLSEGRGTTRPFEQIGAPWLDPMGVIEAVGTIDGARLRPVEFQPQFSKYEGEVCRGIFIHLLDREEFHPVFTYLKIIQAIRKIHPEKFAWRSPPYEGVLDRLPFDLLIGRKEIREMIEQGVEVGEILNRFQGEEFLKLRRDYLIY